MGRPKTHGLTKSRIYHCWSNMHSRTKNPKDKEYVRYGGRGIKVCKKWEKFDGFFEDMQNGYKDTLTLDRIDTNGDYSKDNCRWATSQEQGSNKRNNVKFKGETVSEAERRLGLAESAISRRIKIYGWTKERAFSETSNCPRINRYGKWSKNLKMYVCCKSKSAKRHKVVCRLYVQPLRK